MTRISVMALMLGSALSAARLLAQAPSAPPPEPPPFRVQGIGLTVFPAPKPMLLRIEAVDDELRLTEAQKQRNQEIFERFYETLRAARANVEPDKFGAARKAAMDETETAFQKNLEPGQWDRLDQIQIQVEGPMAFSRPEIQKRLGLSDDQVQKVQAIVNEGQQVIAKSSLVMQGPKPGAAPASAESIRKRVEGPEFQAAMEKSRQATRAARAAVTARIGTVLTEPQRAAYRKMLGAQYDLEKLRSKMAESENAFAFLAARSGLSGQRADPRFDATVPHPAYTKEHPRVLFDEAHHNFHTAGGRYKPFADIITNDGYRVAPNREKFARDVLAKGDVLVIANALGAEPMGSPDSAKPAFTEAECDAVREWVKAGGALLLITDHYPMGSAAEVLANRFRVDMSKGATFDPAHSDKESPSFLLFTRENTLLGDHPITRGRDGSERVNRVLTFTGQSLKGPAESVALLKLADSAMDRTIPGNTQVPAAGRAQGLAMTLGKGRVVVLGEAAQLSAQVVGLDGRPFGMNVPGIDNRQFALNIMHWLSGLMD